MAQDGIKITIGQDENGQRRASIAIVRHDGKVTYVNLLHTAGKDFAQELRKAVERAEHFRQTGDFPKE